MRAIILASCLTMAASGAAWAQSDAQPDAAAAPAPAPVMHHHRHHHYHHSASALPDSGVERPIDKGPNTPEANGAYQGGGVILQGAPGAPAPVPQATPPGQAPANSVPN